jgi:hypothetical protein
MLGDFRHEKKRKTDYTGLIIGLIVSPIVIIFIELGHGPLGRAVAIDLGCIMGAIRTRWDLRNRFWFWGFIVVLLAVHVPLFLLVEWPEGLIPGIAWLPFALVDYSIVVGGAWFIETFIIKSAAPESAVSDE